MGVRIDEQYTPRTYRLMQRVLTDAGFPTYGVKNKYNRTRPFALHNEGTCTPQDEEICEATVPTLLATRLRDGPGRSS